MDPWATCVIVDHTVDYRTVHQTSLSRIYTRNYYFLQSEVSFRTRNQFQFVRNFLKPAALWGREGPDMREAAKTHDKDLY